MYLYSDLHVGILQEILKSYDDEKISELSDSALKLLESLPPLDGGGANERSMAVQLQGEAINLWNKTVALRSAGAVSSHLNAQSMCIEMYRDEFRWAAMPNCSVAEFQQKHQQVAMHLGINVQ